MHRQLEAKGRTRGRAKLSMSLERERRQKSAQAELATEDRGEAPNGDRSGEAPTAAQRDQRSGNDHGKLMERVVERSNMQAALRRVKQNKGSPGSDGMTLEELTPYLVSPA